MWTHTRPLTLSTEDYALLRQAILQTLPTDEAGMDWHELCQTVAPDLPNTAFPHLGAVRRHARLAQKDLEAHGLIERLTPTHPVRLRRTS